MLVVTGRPNGAQHIDFAPRRPPPPQLDLDGQPLYLAWNFQRRMDAGIDELIGLIRGILADGEVSEADTVTLAAWTLKHGEIATDWPVNVLSARLNRIFADGRVDDLEREDLKALLVEIVGENDNLLVTTSTTLPLSAGFPADDCGSARVGAAYFDLARPLLEVAGAWLTS